MVYEEGNQSYKTMNLDLSEKNSYYQVSFRTDEIKTEDIPFKTALIGNYPNPFNPSTTISFTLAQSENVKLSIYNVKGQVVKTLINSQQEAGRHSVVWNGDDDYLNKVASGIYFYRLETSAGRQTKRMILMK